MLIDHIAWAFVPTGSLLGQVMHFIGRLTGPTMAFFIAEGYQHTRNVKKYAARLGVFAFISWFAFIFCDYGTLLPLTITNGQVSAGGMAISFYIASSDLTVNLYPWFGVIYTLFLSLLAIWLWDKGKCPKAVKIAGIVGLIILSFLGDWPIFDILFALFLFIYRNNPKKKWCSFYIIAGIFFIMASLMNLDNLKNVLFQLGVFLPPLLLQFFYNGEGGSRKKIHRWFFYVFYPLHLFIIGLISYYIGN